MPRAGADSRAASGARGRLERALAAHRVGDLEQAERLYRELLRRQPEHALARHHLGVLLHQSGRFDAARAALEEAERLVPGRVELLLDHARILTEQGRPTDALPRFRSLLRLRPGLRDATAGLAVALAGSGRWPEAEALLQDWLGERAGDAGMRLLLGDLHAQVGNYTEALEAWQAAGQSSRELAPAAMHRRGNLQLRFGAGDAAAASFSEATAIAGDAPWVHCGLAAAASERGDFETMRREAESAVALDELSYTGWYQLTMTPEGCTAEAARGLRRAISRSGGNPEHWLLHLALGRVLDRLGQYDEAFAAFRDAHVLKGRLPDRGDYDFEGEFERIRAHVGAGFIERMAGLEPVRTRPVFIVGMPRSGTTLVESILASHPRVAAGGEMRLVEDWISRHGGAAAAADAPGWIGGIDRATFATLRDAWERNLRMVAGPAQCVTDKLPENFLFLGALAAAFPAAGIVHVRRNPLDTCVSCFTTALAGRRAANLPTLARLGAYYQAYEQLAEFWEHVLPPGRVIDVSYETLVQDPEPAVRGLLDDLGLEWHPGCLEFHKSPGSVSTASVYQVRRPINTDSLGQWRRFAGHLDELHTALGDDAEDETGRG